MGKQYRFLNAKLILMIILNFQSLKGQSRIELESKPFIIKPPTVKQSDHDKLLKSHPNRRSYKSRQSQYKKQSPLEKKTKNYPKPTQRLYLLLSLNLTKAQTSGELKEFKPEMTAHIQGQYRFMDFDSYSFFYGLRIAPFSGTGIIKDIPGRYNYTYIGPSIGFGTLGNKKVVQTNFKNAMNAAKKEKSAKYINNIGWIISSGVAMVAQKTDLDPSVSAPSRDFSSPKGTILDGSGVWIELQLLNFSNKFAATHFSFGLQTGAQKLHIYAGVGYGGWI